MKKRNDYEHREQAALIQWRNLQMKVIPELKGLWATPNGGKREVKTAVRKGRVVCFCPSGKRQKAEGMTPGVPDLFLAVSRLRYHGLFIEMKKPGEKLSKEQKEIKAFLESQGFLVLVCESFLAARQEILFYLGY